MKKKNKKLNELFKNKNERNILKMKKFFLNSYLKKIKTIRNKTILKRKNFFKLININLKNNYNKLFKKRNIKKNIKKKKKYIFVNNYFRINYINYLVKNNIQKTRKKLKKNFKINNNNNIILKSLLKKNSYRIYYKKRLIDITSLSLPFNVMFFKKIKNFNINKFKKTEYYNLNKFTRNFLRIKKRYEKPFSLERFKYKKYKKKKFLDHKLSQIMKFKIFFNNKLKLKKKKYLIRRKIKALSLYTSRHNEFNKLLNTRIDVLLYNLQIFKSIGDIHLFIKNKNIIINGKIIFNIGYLLKDNDIMYFNKYYNFIIKKIILSKYKRKKFFLLNPLYIYYDYDYSYFIISKKNMKQNNIKIKEIDTNIVCNFVKFIN